MVQLEIETKKNRRRQRRLRVHETKSIRVALHKSGRIIANGGD
jgi:hypothetical protein